MKEKRRGRKEDRVRERKLEKDGKRRRKKNQQREERTYKTLWPDALASSLPLCANL